MRNAVVFLTISVALTACGGGSSSDPAVMEEVVQPTDAGGMDMATADAGNTDSMNMETAGTGGTGSESMSGEVSSPVVVPVGGGSSAQVNQYGLVNISNEEFVQLEASFFSFGGMFDSAFVIEQFRPTPGSCTVDRFEIGGEIPTIPAELNTPNFGPISAGEVLTVSSNGNTYTELAEVESFGITFYEMQNEMLTIPAPPNLTISIPGDQFAAFTDVAIPPVIPLQVTSPSSDALPGIPGIPDFSDIPEFAEIGGLAGFDTGLFTITPTTQFTWEAGTDPRAIIEISASSSNNSANELVTLDCTVLDNGSFTIPSDIQAEMGTSFSGVGTISRDIITIFQNGNSVLAVVSSAESGD